MEAQEIKKFYDDYARSQISTGVNERHHSIREIVMTEGALPGMCVLEMGCGVGTLTGLLAPCFPKGHLLAVDLSPASIEQAKLRLKSLHNLELRVADVVNDDLPGGPFDRIVLPDILEHIPTSLHDRLFARIKGFLAPDGKVIIHSPDPFYSEYLAQHHPELLQVVDQPLHHAALFTSIGGAGLVVSKLQRYSIWTDRPDYMYLVLEHAPKQHAYRKIIRPVPSFVQRIISRLGR